VSNFELRSIKIGFLELQKITGNSIFLVVVIVKGEDDDDDVRT
jgi:hypothetical protein